MKKLIIPLLLMLAACNTVQTPQDRYYALTESVTVVAQAAEAYVDTCKAQPAADPCRANFPKINLAANTMLTTLHEADKVFVTKDSAYYDLSLTAGENAVKDLKAIMGGK